MIRNSYTMKRVMPTKQYIYIVIYIYVACTHTYIHEFIYTSILLFIYNVLHVMSFYVRKKFN